MRWVLALALLVGVAEAARPKREEPVVVPEAAPVVPAVVALPFGDVVAGLDHGGLPAGMASLSAQACNACHYDAHDGWKASGHAGAGSPAWAAAARANGNPVCTACHQPLLAQRPSLFAFDAGDVGAVRTAPNPAFDATLSIEGVGCAACHVRDGVVVTGHPLAAPSTAHPGLVAATDFGDAASCAACHQLTWPGGAAPLYDTWGEWSRSGYAAAGVDCVDCHLARGPDGERVGHDMDQDPARALTVEIAAPGVTLHRGGGPLALEVRLANTGAGHAVPTGSPWRALRVELAFEGQGPKGVVEVGRQEVLLARTVEAVAPWGTSADTRLQVGERRALPWSAALPADAPPGPWAFVVRVRDVVAGQPASAPSMELRLPLDVD